MTEFEALLSWTTDQAIEIEALKRSIARQSRMATVEESDVKKGYRYKLGEGDDGKPILSPWMPHPEKGGDQKTWNPMPKGEIVMLVNPTGDMRQGYAVRGGFSDQFKQPSESMEEAVRDFWDKKAREVIKKDGSYTMTVDKQKAEVTPKFARVAAKDGDSRAAASDKCAKIRIGSHWIAATPGGIVCSSIPVVGPDPDPSI